MGNGGRPTPTHPHPATDIIDCEMCDLSSCDISLKVKMTDLYIKCDEAKKSGELSTELSTALDENLARIRKTKIKTERLRMMHDLKLGRDTITTEKVNGSISN